MAKIGFVTCKDLSRYFVAKEDPRFTHDDWVAAEGLRKRGHEVVPIVWGASPETLDTIDLLVVRSPWDYMDSPENCTGLMSWLQDLYKRGLPVENHVGLMLWNLDKRYLFDLERAGVPIVPSQLLPGTAPIQLDDLQGIYERQGAFVLKPTRSAGARDTFLIDDADVASCLVEKNGQVKGDFHSWRAGRDFLVQPFLNSVKEVGEWSLVYFGTTYSHAVRKLPPEEGWLVQDELGGSLRWEDPPAEVTEVAGAAIRSLPTACSVCEGRVPLYARVDVLFDATGSPVIGELELVEPELFFLKRAPHDPAPCEEAVALFCDELAQRIKPIN